MVNELRLMYVADDENPILGFSFDGLYFIAFYDYWDETNSTIISWIDDPKDIRFVHDFGSIISMNPYRDFRLVSSDDYKKYKDIIMHVEQKAEENLEAIKKRVEIYKRN